MLHDVAECCIPKRGHCGLALNCQGQIKVIISGMGHNFFVFKYSAFKFCMYMYYDMAECYI